MLPPFKGKQRLSRWLFKSYIATKRDVFTNGAKGCKFKIPTLKENVGFEIFINGIYESDTIDFIVGRIEKGKVLLDLGANIGAISIPVCKRRTDISIICVEAAPWLFEYLKYNIEANGMNHVTLINKALSNVTGNAVQFYSPRDKFGKGSLAPVFTNEGVVVETITVETILKDIKTEDIGFIKIDIEGFEYYAFLGGAEILKRQDAPDILFEFGSWAEDLAPGIKAGAAQELLVSFGYQIYKFANGKVGEKVTSVNEASSMLFATKKY